MFRLAIFTMNMVLSYAFCNVSRASIRKEAAHRSEQVNELLFGERAEVLEINDDDWARIRCEWDGYEGWCRSGQLALVSRKEYRKNLKFIASKHTDKLEFENGDLWLPLGSDLRSIKGGKIIVCNLAGKYKGKKLPVDKLTLNSETLKDAGLRYMHAPYQWGGRTMAGIDCSGLTQMAFKLCGRAIPRDADQQALEGETVDFLQHAKCGDLAFFNNADGKIVHVGILLDERTILHATGSSGRVVIDPIDQGGIISAQLRKRTHTLRFVKRYF